MRRFDGSPLTWPAGAVLVTIFSVGCAGSSSIGAPGADQARSEPTAHYIRGVPFVPGEPGACGPAALASVLAHRGDPATVEDIARVIAAPSLAGVLPLDLERYAASRGLGATVHTTTGSLAWLRERVARDQPVVAFLDLGIGPIRQGHFVVVVGYDDQAGRVLLYSGRDADAAMSYRRFTAAWRRTDFWALTVEPPAGHGVRERSAS